MESSQSITHENVVTNRFVGLVKGLEFAGVTGIRQLEKLGRRPIRISLSNASLGKIDRGRS